MAYKHFAYQWNVHAARADEAYRLMTYEQRGVYRELLDHQWLEGSIPSDPGELARMLRIRKHHFLKLWATIAPKFPVVSQKLIANSSLRSTSETRLCNKRLELYRAELEQFCAEQSKRGLKGAEARWRRHHNGDGGGNAWAMLADGSSTSTSTKTDPNVSLKSVRVTKQPVQTSAKVPRTSPAGEFLAWFQSEYKNRRSGASYFVIWEKHMPIVTRLLKLHEPARLRLHATILLTTDEEWTESTDRGIEILSTKINWLEDRLAAWEAKRHALAPV